MSFLFVHWLSPETSEPTVYHTPCQALEIQKPNKTTSHPGGAHFLEKDMKTVYDIHDKSYHGAKHRNWRGRNEGIQGTFYL